MNTVAKPRFRAGFRFMLPAPNPIHHPQHWIVLNARRALDEDGELTFIYSCAKISGMFLKKFILEHTINTNLSTEQRVNFILKERDERCAERLAEQGK